PVGSLRGRRQGRFQNFAQFSPSGTMILTNASNGRLQLWKLPLAPDQAALLRQGYLQGFRRDTLLGLLQLEAAAPDLTPAALALAEGGAARESSELSPRLWNLGGHEIRHFLPNGPAASGCAVFAPDESVLFTGGADKVLHVWRVPQGTAGQLVE